MICDNSGVRRQDRFLTEEAAPELLRLGEHGVLSMSCGTRGGVYGIPVNYVWDGAGALYICKYSPPDTDIGLVYIEKSFPPTEIIRLDINVFQGKAKKAG